MKFFFGEVFSFIIDAAGKVAENIVQGGRTRLTVSSIEALPSDQPIKYLSQFLQDTGSRDMTVDGSSTPVVFTKVFTAGELAFMEKLVLEIKDGGGSGLDDFGSGPALTNGLLVEVQVNGVIIFSVPIKTNSDLLSAADLIFEVGQFQGAPVTIYNFVFRKPVALFGDDDDFVRVTVRDDLTNIEALQMSFKRWEVI